MHNKLMVADNAAAIVGGINIGDHYYGVNTGANFRDLDVLAVGPGWQRLRGAPVAAIAGLTGLPIGGAPFVVPVADYQVDIDAGGDGWVRVPSAGGAQRVAVSYTAGLAADWAGCPPALAQGLVMLVAHLFQHREDDAMPPAAVAALWRPFRNVRLLEQVR